MLLHAGLPLSQSKHAPRRLRDYDVKTLITIERPWTLYDDIEEREIYTAGTSR